MASSSSASSGQDPRLCLLYAARKGLVKEFGYGREGRAQGLLDVKDKDGRTVVHYAAAGDKTHDVCKYLVEQLKLDVNVKDYKDFIPLHTSAIHKNYSTSVYLLDHGAQPNARNYKGLTPLHCAAEIGQSDQLCLLISRGAEVDAQSLRGTPLQIAAAEDMESAVQTLLIKDANPNSISQQMHTPLMLAILANSINCTRLLLKVGADANMVSHGQTPLEVAIFEGQTEIIKSLLKAGADPNVPGVMAAMRGNRAGVKALMQATKPIPNVRDWSVDGIIKYANSDEAENLRQSRAERKFHEAKAKGAEAVSKQNYLEATHWYTEALTAKPKDATLYSNLSLCYARMNQGQEALQNALLCIVQKPDWPKAYYRAGVALRMLQRNEKAVAAFEKALTMDPDKELQDAKREAEAAMRSEGTGEDQPGACFDYVDFFRNMLWSSLSG